MSQITTAPVSINTTPGTEANARITRDQIGFWVLAGIGAHDYVRDDKTGLLQFLVNGGRCRKIRIRLTPADTYAVEIGHLDYTTFDWVVDEYVSDIYADVLGEVVERLYAVNIDHNYDPEDDKDF